MPIPGYRLPSWEDNAPIIGVPPEPDHWGHTKVTITGANGTGEEIHLTDFSGRAWPAVFLQDGATGLDMPPMEVYADTSPNLDGGWFRSTRAAERAILLPLYLYGIDRRTILNLKRKLSRTLNPKNGYCVLRFTEGDSTSRYLTAYYKGGMEGNEGSDNAGFTWCRYGIQLTAFDPWFYGDRDVIAEWKTGVGKVFLKGADKPFLPLAISEGTISSRGVAIFNPGDVEAWPVWEIGGPVRSFTISSPDGRKFGINPKDPSVDLISTGETLTIDTRPGYKTITRSNGENFWPRLDPNPAMFELPAGESKVNVQMNPGASNAALRLQISPRFESY
ncbi:phage tail domain-containing protein [Streptomyces sp. IMTB 2501]|uniref:phage tail domain-containing protein n=1 Tax=Streptomyces sp. IMTB 2501 TaxID=1776340 RepID=UPI0009A22D78|nr:phage tail domain-containing protein [Streptomyces sp. IMTB 2501]